MPCHDVERKGRRCYTLSLGNREEGTIRDYIYVIHLKEVNFNQFINESSIIIKKHRGLLNIVVGVETLGRKLHILLETVLYGFFGRLF